jgi:hypothetical protein
MQKTFIKNERRIFNMKNVVALQEGHLRYGTDSINQNFVTENL